jgi:hypothetical protein
MTHGADNRWISPLIHEGKAEGTEYLLPPKLKILRNNVKLGIRVRLGLNEDEGQSCICQGCEARERMNEVRKLVLLLYQPTHHHLSPIYLESVYFLNRNTSSMTSPTILSILMKSHKDSSTTSLTRTFPSKTLNFSIRINRIILQSSHFLPSISLFFEKDNFLCLCLIFLGVVYCFFFLFLAPPSRLKTNWTVASCEIL